MKKLFVISLIVMSTSAYAEKEFQHLSELPVEISSQLDLLTSGALSKRVIDRLCDGKPERVSVSEVNSRMGELLNEKVPPIYKKLAIRYVEDAIDTKTRAFRQVYADKSCSDLENIKGVAWHAGFKN